MCNVNHILSSLLTLILFTFLPVTKVCYFFTSIGRFISYLLKSTSLFLHFILFTYNKLCTHSTNYQNDELKIFYCKNVSLNAKKIINFFNFVFVYCMSISYTIPMVQVRKKNVVFILYLRRLNSCNNNT